MTPRIWIVVAALLLGALPACSRAAPPPFALRDGDRVVWLGGALVEREQLYGYWEAALHSQFPKAHFTVRNLGWSGDTVFGEARAGFDSPEQGFQRLVQLVKELQPTVLLISYGSNEAFAGRDDVAAFEKGLNRLLDGVADTRARVVLLSPLPAEPSDAQSDVTARNTELDRYRQAIGKVAAARKLQFADLYRVAEQLHAASPSSRWTDNGMHLTDTGYRVTAPAWLAALGCTPGAEASEPLRAIVAKNELFFYRWRPQNETYLFGFRKREQGRNAAEIAQFDPLIAAAELEIQKLR